MEKSTSIEGGEESDGRVTFAVGVEGIKENIQIGGSTYGDNLTEPENRIKSLRIMMFDYNSKALDFDYTVDYIEGQEEISFQLPFSGLTTGTTLKKHIVALANVRGEDPNVAFEIPTISSYDDIKNIKVTMKGTITKNSLLPMAAQDDPTRGIEIVFGSENNIELTLSHVVARFGFTNVTRDGVNMDGQPVDAKDIFVATKIALNNHATSYAPFDSDAAPTLAQAPMEIALDETENIVFYMLQTPRNTEDGKSLSVTVTGKTDGSPTENFTETVEIAKNPLGDFNGSIIRNCAYAMYVKFERDIDFEGKPKPDTGSSHITLVTPVEIVGFENTTIDKTLPIH